MNYLIRDCEPADLPAIIKLCKEHARFEKATYTSSGKLKLLRKAIFGKNPCLFCWVVEINDRIIGYITYTFDFSTWDASKFLYMDCLFIKTSFRGHGIGEEIMKRLSRLAKQCKCINMQWQTPHLNERAINFYKSKGGIGNAKIRFVLSLASIN